MKYNVFRKGSKPIGFSLRVIIYKNHCSWDTVVFCCLIFIIVYKKGYDL